MKRPINADLELSTIAAMYKTQTIPLLHVQLLSINYSILVPAKEKKEKLQPSPAMSSSSSSSVVGAGDTPWQAASAIVARPLPVSGSHVLTIDGYSGTKDLANGKGITSETFAVGRHRWYIRYFPDGYSSGDVGWISIYLHLVPTDDADEVNARYKISLLGHDGEQVPSYGTESQTCRTFSSNTGPWGCPQLITRKDLEESVYLEDDVLSIRCEVTMPREIFTEHGEPPPSDMRRHFGRLLPGGAGADVEFKVGGETFSAHRCVLAARSSVFRALLLGPTKMNHGACIRISGMEARVFKAMLQFIYTDSLPDMDEDDVVLMTQHLIVAAKKYNLERLKLVCAEKLCNYMDMDFLTDPPSAGASSTFRDCCLMSVLVLVFGISFLLFRRGRML
jgi:speckle-type POZ protein